MGQNIFSYSNTISVDEVVGSIGRTIVRLKKEISVVERVAKILAHLDGKAKAEANQEIPALLTAGNLLYSASLDCAYSGQDPHGSVINLVNLISIYEDGRLSVNKILLQKRQKEDWLANLQNFLQNDIECFIEKHCVALSNNNWPRIDARLPEWRISWLKSS